MEELVGRTLGRYELREMLGEGGMGAVFRAYQANLKREVAVKVLPRSLAKQHGYAERFTQEAETAAALEHPHIVPIVDYGTTDGISFVVMRLLTGGTLADRLDRHAQGLQPLPSMGEISHLLHQLGSALDYAHTRGVIHRDIKPSNVMFDNQGNAYLVDFGIAKLMGSTAGLTATGTTVGTPSYMSPEQWKSESLTPAADQYALGVMVYAMVTGRVPFEATTPFGLMHKHVNEAPTPPQAIRTDIPEAVGLVINRALEKDHTRRFPTVTAFAQTFARAIQGQEGVSTGFASKAAAGVTHTIPTPPSVDAATPPMEPTVVEPDTPSAFGPPSVPHRPTTPPTTPPISRPIPTLAPPTAKPIYKNPLAWGVAVVLVAIIAGLLVVILGGEEDKATDATEDPRIMVEAATQTSEALTTSVAVAVEGTRVAAEVTSTELPPEPTATLADDDTTATSDAESTTAPTAQPSPEPTIAVPTAEPTAVAIAVPPAGNVIDLPAAADVRDAPDESAGVLRSLPVDHRVVVGESSADGDWVQITYSYFGSEESGYVPASVFADAETSSDTPVTASDITEPLQAAILNPTVMHQRPDTESAAILALNIADRLAVVAVTEDGQWYEVRAQVRGTPIAGYILASDVEISDQPANFDEAATIWPQEATIASATMFYEAPREDSAIIRALVAGERILAISTTEDGEWYLIRARIDDASTTGFVRAEIIAIVDSSAQADETDDDVVMVDVEPQAAQIAVGSAAIYLTPNQDTAPIQSLPINYDLTVLAQSEDGVWLFVTFEFFSTEVEGFVLAENVSTGEPDAADVDQQRAILNSSTAMREAPDDDAPTTRALLRGWEVTVLEVVSGGEWVRIEYTRNDSTETGYIPASAVDLDGDEAVTSDEDPVSGDEPQQRAVLTSSTAMREAPDDDAPTMRALLRGWEVIVLEVVSGGEWVRIEYTRNDSTETGYIPASAVDLDGDEAVTSDEDPVSGDEPQQRAVLTSSTAMREAPDDDAPTMRALLRGWEVIVLEVVSGGEWVRVEYTRNNSTETGYIPASAVDLNGDEAAPSDEDPVSGDEPQQRAVLTSSTAMREAPDDDAPTMRALLRGWEVIVLEVVSGGEWVRVEYTRNDSTETGYIPASAVDLDGGDEASSGNSPFVASNAEWQPVIEAFHGIEMALVPSSCFGMGSDIAPEENPIHEQCIDSPFWINVTEVTVEAYTICVEDGMCEPVALGEDFDDPAQPMTGANWFQAQDYCAWQGGRLPTEAEWEYAARGPDDWTFPWGFEFDGDHVVYAFNAPDDFPASVGTRPAGASWVGALDMSGNVWEWTNSLFLDYPYGPAFENPDETDTNRTLRGGAWTYDEYRMRASSRSSNSPGRGADSIGFRCVRDDETAENGAISFAPHPAIIASAVPVYPEPDSRTTPLRALITGYDIDVQTRTTDHAWVHIAYQVGDVMEEGYVRAANVELLNGAWDDVPVVGDSMEPVVGEPVTVTFNVTVPEDTLDTVFIAGAFGSTDLPEWDPGAIAMEDTGDGQWTITLELLSGEVIEYKFARGSWEAVEKHEDCEEVANRVLRLEGTEPVEVNDVVAQWRDVAGCP